MRSNLSASSKIFITAVCSLALAIATGPEVRAAEPPAEIPVIEWYLIDLPPVQIASGSLQGKGYTDRIRWRLIAGLTNFKHRLKLANVQRIVADIQTKPNICNPAFLRTPEREQFMEFAEPLHVQYANGAVMLKSRMSSFSPHINVDGVLALDALLNATKGNLAIQTGRSYGAALDALAEKAKQANRLIVLTSARPVEAKLGLLQKERADVAFLYPIELELTTRNTTQDNLYEFLPVAGNNIFTQNFLACSKSPLGKQVIADANPIIARERDEFFAAAYREWLPPENLKLHASFHQSAFNHPVLKAPIDKKVQLLDDTIAACLLDGGTWYQKKCEKGANTKVH